MQLYGKAEEVGKQILQAFESGSIPQAIAPIFIKRKDKVPCRSWSWNNQLIVALMGHEDARGFQQWKEVNRHVRAGEKAFHILIPLTKKVDDEQDGKERVITYGFKTAAVFGLSQTEGEPLKGDVEAQNWIDKLPLIDVAKGWNLSVNAFNGERAKPLGYYKPGQAIALGVENLSTWAHELIHAADDRLEHLEERGQHWASETVAELGGAILLECLGYSQDSDRGGCFHYIKSYAEKNGKDVLGACLKVFKRTCEAVAFALETAERLSQQQPAAA